MSTLDFILAKINEHLDGQKQPEANLTEACKSVNQWLLDHYRTWLFKLFQEKGDAILQQLYNSHRAPRVR